MSAWRAAFCHLLAAHGFDGTVVIPEFLIEKSFEPDAFSRRQTERFRGAAVPPDLSDRVRPESWGVLEWEERMLERASVVAAWLDVGFEQPGIGINARPEIYGLVVRAHAMQGAASYRWIPWAPNRIELAIPPHARAVTRFYAVAHQAGMAVRRNMRELVNACLIHFGTREGTLGKTRCGDWRSVEAGRVLCTSCARTGIEEQPGCGTILADRKGAP